MRVAVKFYFQRRVARLPGQSSHSRACPRRLSAEQALGEQRRGSRQTEPIWAMSAGWVGLRSSGPEILAHRASWSDVSLDKAGSGASLDRSCCPAPWLMRKPHKNDETSLLTTDPERVVVYDNLGKLHRGLGSQGANRAGLFGAHLYLGK